MIPCCLTFSLMIYFFCLTCRYFANYADDNTPYATDINITSLLETLEMESNVLLDWFRVNEMKPNEDKCHLLVINHENVAVKILPLLTYQEYK